MKNFCIIPVGTRVEFIEEWDSFPCDEIVKIGERGTVTQTGEDFFVKLDTYHEGFDEWENCVDLDPRDFAEYNEKTAEEWVRMYVKPIPMEEFAPLCVEFQAWCNTNGLPQLSADELQCELFAAQSGEESQVTVPVTEERKYYVARFLERWDAMLKADEMRRTLAGEV